MDFALNWYLILATALVPLIVGFVWYGPLFGKLWMQEAGITEESMKGSNMALIFGISLVFGVFLAVGLTPIVIHQMGVFSVLQSPDAAVSGSPTQLFFKDFMTNYGTNFRTFKHGAFHGTLSGLLLFLPILGTNALYERKSWKYIFLNVGFWMVCAAIMGGLISGFA